MIHFIPPGFLEFLLFGLFVAVAVVMARAVRRRRAVQPKEASAHLPDLETEIRVRAKVLRVFRDPDQGAWLVEATMGSLRLTFCAVDYAANADRYAALAGATGDFALYSLGAIAPGGVESIQTQIVDYDPEKISANTLRLVRAGRHANDYAVIGRVVWERTAVLDTLPTRVYRVEVERRTAVTLFIDIAVESADQEVFAPDTLIHGSARLFAYLAPTNPAP